MSEEPDGCRLGEAPCCLIVLFFLKPPFGAFSKLIAELGEVVEVHQSTIEHHIDKRSHARTAMSIQTTVQYLRFFRNFQQMVLPNSTNRKVR